VDHGYYEPTSTVKHTIIVLDKFTSQNVLSVLVLGFRAAGENSFSYKLIEGC